MSHIQWITLFSEIRRLLTRLGHAVLSVRHLFIFGWLPAFALAAPDPNRLSPSIVVLNLYTDDKLIGQVDAFVVQSDRFNGYVVANASRIAASEIKTVSLPGSNAELVAQQLHTDKAFDFALFKVNGLDLPSITFSRTEYRVGDVAWSVTRNLAEGGLVISRGAVRND